MGEPLLEPGVLVTDNCPGCRGTGFRVVGHDQAPPERFRDEAAWARWMAQHERTTPCEDCDGSGRQVREVPLSEFTQMLQQATQRLVAPPPSLLREEARR